MFTKQSLKYCICANILVLAILISIIIILGHDNPYLRIGPNVDLIILGIRIDTWIKYFILQVFVAINEILDVSLTEIGYPFLTLQVYDTDKKEIHDFTRVELQLYTNIYYIIGSVRYVFTLLITLSQVDIALLKVIYGESITIYNVRRMLKHKVFPDERTGLTSIFINDA
jgi:hypothetical protein